MEPLFRRGLFVFVSFLIVVLILNSLIPAGPEDQSFSRHLRIPFAGTEWSFNASRHANDFTFTEQQCDAAFPALYHEIDRALDYWGENGGVRAENIDLSWSKLGAIRALIYNKQLYVIESKNATNDPQLRRRALATLNQINRAISTSREPIPNIEFAFKVTDVADPPTRNGVEHTMWSYARNTNKSAHDKLWLMPDFNLWSWEHVVGSFVDFQRAASEYDVPITEKTPKLVWRGALWVNEKIRGALVDVTKDKSWSDVSAFDWGNKTDQALKKLTMPEHCKWMFGAHTEGRSWSGRLKYLINCRSATIVHDLEWTAHWYHLLESQGVDQNFVPVRRDWSNLEETIEYYLTHPHQAQRIADNAVLKFRERYLSPAAEVCYWRRLFKVWAEVSFEPQLYETMERQIGESLNAGLTKQSIWQERKLRGMTYEEYIIREGNYPGDE
ncbi:hypothetical protein H2203_002398 [Taxawa tesnikishii (nom. ined.)]|nr:hypothetical protein H2203_002398 [Dothideales sp. JES 119]